MPRTELAYVHEDGFVFADSFRGQGGRVPHSGSVDVSGLWAEVRKQEMYRNRLTSIVRPPVLFRGGARTDDLGPWHDILLTF